MNDADAINRVIKRAPRRRHSAALKAQVLQACRQPHASIAAIARQHDLNANVVHRWRVNERNTVAPIAAVSQTASPSGFVAVSFHPETPAPAEPMPLPDIRIELQRGNGTAVVHWPVQAAASCAAWLHEWLR